MTVFDYRLSQTLRPGQTSRCAGLPVGAALVFGPPSVRKHSPCSSPPPGCRGQRRTSAAAAPVWTLSRAALASPLRLQASGGSGALVCSDRAELRRHGAADDHGPAAAVTVVLNGEARTGTNQFVLSGTGRAGGTGLSPAEGAGPDGRRTRQTKEHRESRNRYFHLSPLTCLRIRDTITRARARAHAHPPCRPF